MIDFLNSLATIGALAISIVYGIGFMIIIFNLSRLGIEEFQIINFKYFFIGFTFIVIHFALLGISWLFSLMIFTITYNSINQIFLTWLFFPATLIASIVFVFYISKPSKNSKRISTRRSMYSRFYFYVVTSIIGGLYPSYFLNLNILNAISVKYSLSGFRISLNKMDLDFLSGIVVSFWLFFFWCQLGYYARFYYGTPNPLSSVDRTGIGLPNQVQFIFDEDKSKFFTQIGMQIIKPGITSMVQLLETTNDCYIVYIPPDNDLNTITSSAVKLSKDIVVGVIYHHDEPLPTEKK